MQKNCTYPHILTISSTFPNHDTTIVERFKGCIFENTEAAASGKVFIVVKHNPLQSREEERNMFHLVRSIGEMFSASDTILVNKTLENCFSFKFQEVDMLKCLAAV